MLGEILETLFADAGSAIQRYAKGLFVVEVIASVITGIIVWTEVGDVEGFWAFCGITVGGIIVAYIFSLFLCAFGQLVENSEIIAQEASSVEEKKEIISSSAVNEEEKKYDLFRNISSNYNTTKKPSGPDFWTCENCKRSNHKTVGTCGCGTRKPN